MECTIIIYSGFYFLFNLVFSGKKVYEISLAVYACLIHFYFSSLVWLQPNLLEETSLSSNICAPGVNTFEGKKPLPTLQKKTSFPPNWKKQMSKWFHHYCHPLLLTLTKAPASSLQLAEFPLISSAQTALAVTVHTKILSFVVLVCLYSCASVCPIVSTTSIVWFLLWAPGGKEWSLFNLLCTTLRVHTRVDPVWLCLTMMVPGRTRCSKK